MGKYSNDVLNVLVAKEYELKDKWIRENYYKDLGEKEWIEKLKKEIEKILHKKKSLKLKEKLENFNSDNFNKEKEKIQQELEEAEGINFIVFCDEDFPKKNLQNQNLQEDYPIFLAYKGDIKLLKQERIGIAVIGLTNPTQEIEEMEKEIIKCLEDENINLVSGLAFGCDQIAHEESLKINLPNIAILPSTIQNILPKKNQDLANQIAQEGLLLSEYYREPKDHYEQIARYIKRDRLQALFSDMVILIASYSSKDTQKDKKLDSGAKHAMQKAKDYGTKRAVMYDEKFAENEMFNLNRDLIKEALEGIKETKQINEINNINLKHKDFKILNSLWSKKILTKFIKVHNQKIIDYPKGKQENLFDHNDLD